MRTAAGFTLVELVVIIVILGILAVVALPRMDTSIYRSAEFHDRVLAGLRYAQKTATSHRRSVCVTFPDTRTAVFQIDADKNGVCETALTLPGGNTNQVVSSNASTTFSVLPAALVFATDGTSTDRTIGIASGTSITVVGATGNVF